MDPVRQTLDQFKTLTNAQDIYQGTRQQKLLVIEKIMRQVIDLLKSFIPHERNARPEVEPVFSDEDYLTRRVHTLGLRIKNLLVSGECLDRYSQKRLIDDRIAIAVFDWYKSILPTINPPATPAPTAAPQPIAKTHCCTVQMRTALAITVGIISAFTGLYLFNQ